MNANWDSGWFPNKGKAKAHFQEERRYEQDMEYRKIILSNHEVASAVPSRND